MSGYPEGHYDDGYGHGGHGDHGDSYYQDEHGQAYYDPNDYGDGYYDRPYGFSSPRDILIGDCN